MTELRLKAVIDACVLFQAAVRDTLLRAAEAGLYEVYWSEIILDEISRNLLKTGTMKQKQVQRLLAALRQFFPKAMVKGFEYLIPEMKNDDKDRHVLAAAVVAEAQVIVTSNLKDFPEQVLKPYEIEALSPDEFLIYLFDEAPKTMMEIVTQQAAELRNPPRTVTEVLDELVLHTPQFSAIVRSQLNSVE